VELPAFLDADPPAGILVGLAGAEDRALISYAQSRKYVRSALGEKTRYGTLTLFVAPERR
jgi:hypothetical protein